MSKHRRKGYLHLEHWEEIIGKLNRSFNDDYYIYLEIDDQILRFRKGSKEATHIQRQLSEDLVEGAIAILRTDMPEKPILIHIIPKS